MNTHTEDKTLSTADFAAAAERREDQPPQRQLDQHAERAAREQREPIAMQRDIDDTRMEGMRQGGATAPVRAGQGGGEQLAPLFLPQVAQNFRSQWSEVQIGFVDDPAQAVKRADELVAQVMKNLAQTFAEERSQIEGQLDQADTEHLRVALRRYRSFFERLLSL